MKTLYEQGYSTTNVRNFPVGTVVRKVRFILASLGCYRTEIPVGTELTKALDGIWRGEGYVTPLYLPSPSLFALVYSPAPGRHYPELGTLECPCRSCICAREVIDAEESRRPGDYCVHGWSMRPNAKGIGGDCPWCKGRLPS